MFKSVPVIIALFLAVFLLISGEKAEARTPCWAGQGVVVKLSCNYAGYGCYCDEGYYYQRFSRTGRIADFNLFWPGGEVHQKISKDTLEVTVNYPEEGLSIRILFLFECNANECIALVPSGLIKVKYKGVGVITACGMSPYCYHYCDHYREETATEDAGSPEKAKSLADFVNGLVASQLNNHGNN